MASASPPTTRTLPIAGIELARDRLLPTALSAAVINANLYAPSDAVTVGYLDAVADTSGFDQAVLDAAQALAELDPEAFAETKRRVRQPTLDRIVARGA